MTVTYNPEPNRKLTQDELTMLEEAKKKAPQYDEDNPPLTEAELTELREKARKKREEKRKQNVTIRLDPKTLEKARALGSGYTTILAEIIEEALNGKEMPAEQTIEGRTRGRPFSLWRCTVPFNTLTGVFRPFDPCVEHLFL